MPPQDKKVVPFAFAPNEAPLSPTQVKEPDEKTVLMLFPKRVVITLPDRRTVQFDAGPQEVPESLVDHPYLAAHKVQPYTAPKPVTAKVPVLTEVHLDFLHEEGYAVKTVEEANKLFQNLNPEQRTQLMYRFAEYVTGPKRPKMTIETGASQVIADAAKGIQQSAQDAAKQPEQGSEEGQDSEDVEDGEETEQPADAANPQPRRKKKNQQKAG